MPTDVVIFPGKVLRRGEQLQEFTRRHDISLGSQDGELLINRIDRDNSLIVYQ